MQWNFGIHHPVLCPAMASSELVRNARQHCHQLQTFENIFKAIQTTVKGDKSLNIFSKPCKPFSKPF
jgi:hypothetical protein